MVCLAEYLSAGFPSAAEGYEDEPLNLHDWLVQNPAATFFYRVRGDELRDEFVRDGAILADFGLPVFARGLSMRGTGKDYGARGWINFPTLFVNLTVQAGDLIVGDTDGVVAIPRLRAQEVVAAAEAREAKESAILERIRLGERTLEVYKF
jgi:4-hydroxy-4-methyl-2-oxoglutarate aldolase